MSDDPQATTADGAAQGPGWQQALDELERCLRDASQAIVMLRHSLEGGGAEVRPAGTALKNTGTSAPPAEPAASTDDGAGHSPFERLWDRIEREKMEKQTESSEEPAAGRRGLDLLPHQYLMTVEDRESTVDLVPLHRALLNLAGMEEVSLVSFSNGVPVISLRVEGELDLERLGEAVATAMDRQCEMIPQDTGRLHLRLRAREDKGG